MSQVQATAGSVAAENDAPSSEGRGSREMIAAFAGQNAAYYADRFERLLRGFPEALAINWAAALVGPLWAASRSLWAWFWTGMVGETVALIVIGVGLWGPREEGQASGIDAGLVLVGLLLLIAVRVALGLTANWGYQRRYTQWRIDRDLRTGIGMGWAGVGALLMVLIYPLTVYRFSAPKVPELITVFPTTRKIALGTSSGIDSVVDWLTINLEAFFDGITRVVQVILNSLEVVFVSTPWPVMALLLLIIAWRVAGWRVMLFTGTALFYIGIFGFWDNAMSTISLVGSSAFICILFGIPVGIWCAKSPRANLIMKPILDFMQTVPSFVYLVPAIAFFSIGKVPGVLATVIFAAPPMIRLTTLGIQQVPGHIKEAAIAFGVSPGQLLMKIELPLSIPTIMAGINQTIMMSLSMVVVAALIGAGGLGYDVVFALQHVEAGRGILAGVAIALCAMILDRIIQGGQGGRRSGTMG